MTMSYAHAPHQGAGAPQIAAPNAALLIDFDNVTMGMKSDLGKDLKKLLQSDVIKGKVTVQRAYADWRRYPQYIVPLSERSVDLIFAPAYGSSKKNATDIRMAIDAVELVFTRPEIGTYILLTGDSDFSSCVLKLKEYGKYVIGVGIQESSSDILVQNCDEYYSYNSVVGLKKTTDGDQRSSDPWELVAKAARRMADRDDVMRSDRLKQVMIEIDATFDEGSFGFSKFSRFLSEAASRGLVVLTKLDNGQYEIAPGKGVGSGGGRSRRDDRDDDRRGRGRRGGRGRARDRDRDRDRQPEPIESSSEDDAEAEAPAETSSGAPRDVRSAYGLLVQALEGLRDDERYPARDSDVKRRLLEIQRDFDEGTLGFPKFSRFLKQASEDDVVVLDRGEGGNYEVTLADDATEAVAAMPSGTMAPVDADTVVSEPEAAEEDDEVEASSEAQPEADAPEPESTEPIVRELRPEDLIDAQAPGRLLGPRGGTTRRRNRETPPPLFEGQGRPSASAQGELTMDGAGPEEVVDAVKDPTGTSAEDIAPIGSNDGEDRSGSAREDDGADDRDAADDAGAAAVEAFEGTVDAGSLGLPTDPEAQIRYLTNRWKGVGKRTAETLVETFGEGVFDALQNQAARVRETLPAGRADQVFTAWREDFGRRLVGGGDNSDANRGSGRGRRRGGRGRGGRGRR